MSFAYFINGHINPGVRYDANQLGSIPLYNAKGPSDFTTWYTQ